MKKQVTIIIPTYNEALNIQQCIQRIRQHTAPCHDYHINILVFDSASTDNTAYIVKSLQTTDPSLYLFQEKKKSGLGSAYKQAMQYTIDHFNPDYIFEYDADGSHHPKYLSPMLMRLQNGADAVIGSRYTSGGSIPSHWPWHRKLLSYGGNLIARLILKNRYKDYTSGFRGTRTQLLQQIDLPGLLSNGYAYKLHLFWALDKLGANIEEHPIQFTDRQLGVSKLPSNSIKDSLRVLFILRYREHALYIKTCLVGFCGCVVQFSAFNLARFFLPAIASTILSTEAAILLNFYNNNRFTFKYQHIEFSEKKQWMKKLFQFNVLSAGSIILQMLSVGIWHHAFEATRLEENFALFLGIALGSCVNYWAYRHWIWDKKNELIKNT